MAITPSPDHYDNTWNVGNFIREEGLSFHLGNAVKYVCRCEHKGNKREDLVKAIHYLQDELENTIYESELTGPSGGISGSLQFASMWEEYETDPEMFDR